MRYVKNTNNKVVFFFSSSKINKYYFIIFLRRPILDLKIPLMTWDFILYMSALDNAIAGVLVQEDDARHEHMIYYISQKLIGP